MAGLIAAALALATTSSLTATPASLTFPATNVGDFSPSQAVTITNTDAATVDIQSVETPNTTDFDLDPQAGDCDGTTVLAQDETCTVHVLFTPQATGARSGTLTVESTGGPVDVPLSGTGAITTLWPNTPGFDFGAKDIAGGAVDETFTFTNSGPRTLGVSTVDVTGDSFTRNGGTCTENSTTLAPNDSCTVTVSFDPSTTGGKTGAVTVTPGNGRADPATIDLAGTGTSTALSASPTSLSFGSKDIDDGATVAQTSTVTNTGDQNVNVSSVTKLGTDPGEFTRLTGSPDDCGANNPLAPNEACRVRVEFDPSTVGAKSATIRVSSNAPNTDISVTGTGIQTELSRSPATIAFAKQDIDDGAKGPMESTVTNSGTQPVTLNGISVTGGDAADFTQEAFQAGDCTATTSLTAGQTCKLRYTFDPATTGNKSATITVTSNAPSITVALTGQGTQTLLTRSPGSLSFGNQDIDDGATPSQFSTVTNSGTEGVTISGVPVTGDFAQVTGNSDDCVAAKLLAAGDTCKVRVRFDPTVTGPRTGSATVQSNAADVSIALDGTGIQTSISSSPSSLSFGSKDIDDGATSAQTSTITNTGTEAVPVSGIAIGGTNPGQFELLGGQAEDCTTKASISAGQTCEARVRFDPSSVGAKSATVQVPLRPEGDVALSGTGIQTELSRSPATLSFGSQDIDDGPTSSQTSVVTNSGTEPVTISGVDVTGDFAQVTGDSADCVNGNSLAATASCNVRITFDPTATGARIGSATVHSNAPDVTIGLDGTGTQTSISSSPTSLSFGSKDIDDGPTSAQTSTITNTGTEPVNVSGTSVGGTNPGQFELLSGQAQDCTTKATINAGQTCEARVRFDPSTMGAKSATVQVPSRPEGDIALTGSGIQTELSRSPGSLSFGSQELDAGATAPQTSTVTNSGTEPVTISSVAISGSQRGQFKRLTDQPGTDCAAATVLTAGQTCDLRVSFDPSWEGAKAATVTVSSNAAPITIALTGDGIRTTFARSDVPLDSLEFDGPVNAVAFDSAGRTYVGGAFSSIGRRTGRGVKLTTTDDQPNPAFPDVDGPINAVVADGSGGWFIGGSFATVGGFPRANVAHILSSGAVDTSWNPSGANNTVFAIARSGSQLFVGGDFTQIAGQPSIRLAKLTASSGALDTNWTPDPNNTVAALTISGTDVYAGGNFTLIGGAIRTRLARLDAGLGDTDPAWNPAAVNGLVDAIALDGSGVYVGGAFTQVGPTTRNRIAKFALADAALDATWNPNANGTVNALAFDGSNVYVGGAFTNIGAQPRNRIARLSNGGAGNADNTWDPDANGAVNALSVVGTNVYTVGAFTQIGGQTRSRIARVSTTSGLADSWNPNANGAANALAIAGTDIYVGGLFTSVGGQTARARIARLLPDGTVDPDWDPGSNNTVNALLVSGSDVYAGGQFTSIGGLTRNRIARLTTADGGAADPAWDPDAGAAINSLALSGTNLFVGGGFVTIGGGTHNRLAKISTTGPGTADATWTPSATGSVFALATDGTSVYAGGTFITVNAGPAGNRPFIAKLSAGGSGALDPDWNPSANSTVRALALSGPSLFVGGDFSAIGGQTRNRIAKLSATGTAGDTGTADLAWDPNANNVVRALTIAGNDLYAGGDFTQVGGVSHNNVVRLPTGDGGAHDSGWNPIANGSVNALAATPTRLAVGGAFTTVHSQSRQGVALFDLPRLWRDPSGQQFGSQDIADGPTITRTTVVSNAGAGPITFSALSLTGPNAGDFTRLTGAGSDCTASTTLAPAETCNVRVQFDPSATGVKTAWVDIEAPSTPDATIGLAGAGTHTELTRSPTSLSFGAQDIDDGPAADQESTITNAGSVPVTVDSPALPGDPGGVTITGTDAADFTRLTGEPTDCFDGRVLNAGQTCKVRLEFDPATTGSKTATATVNTDAGNPTIALDGSGIQTQVTPSPTTLAFGKQDIDDSSTADQFSTVTNTGTQPVTFTAIPVTGAGAADFSPATFAAGACTATTTLTAGQTCKLRYTFDPTTVGMKSATVTVTSNAPSITVGLTGEGTQTQLSPAPTSLSFGSKDIDDGGTASQTSTITNSGTEGVTISAVNVTGDFAQSTGNSDDCVASTVLAAGQTCKVRVTFDPTAVHARSGTVTVHSNAPDATVALDGTGIQTELSRTPATLPFGDRDIDDGPASAQDVTVTNSGTESITLSSLTISGGDFAIVSGAGTNCTSTTTMTEGQSCKIYVRFDPATTGSQSQTLTIDSNEVPDLTVTLTGRGTQTELSRSPATLAFGGQDVDSGPSATHTSTVTNSGSEPVTISGVTVGGTDPGEFARLTSAGTDCTSTTVLTAGQTCDVRVQFDPSTQGAKSANVSITSNAATITVDLTGTGKQTKLSRSPTSLSFGSKDIDDGATATQESTVTNIGTEDVTLGSVGIVGTDAGQFVRLTGDSSDCSTSTTLAATETCKVRVQFDPSNVGAKSATARVSANGVDQDVALDGTGIQTELSRSPATLSFGSKDIDNGATDSQDVTITNSGTETVTLTSNVITGDFEQIAAPSNNCLGSTLDAGDQCTLRLVFDPTTTGARTGTATVHSNAPDVSVALDGTGIQTSASIAPTSLAFGSQDIDDGATSAQESTVTNTGTEPVHLAAVSLGGTNPGQFNRLTGQGADCTSSTVLTSNGDSCKVRAEFNPLNTGAKSATITVTSGDVPDLAVSLTGTGTQTELSRSPATLSFGDKDIDDGGTASQTSTVKNSGTEGITISSVGVTGDFAQSTGNSDDCVATKVLAANDTCNVRVTFDPTATGSRTGMATVHSNAADVSVALDGNGIQTSASIAPTPLAFGSKDVDDGATAEQFSTVSNTGTETLHLSSVVLGGTNPGQFNRLTGQGSDCTSSTVLTAGQTCKVRAEFNPVNVGAKSATITMSSTELPDDLTVSLTGTGIQTQLSPAPASLSFGDKDIDDGATPFQESVVTNSGTEAVTISGVNVTGDFVQVANNSDDCVNGKVLAANGLCKVRVAFDPSATGNRTGSATVTSNAPDATIALGGTGIQTELTRAPDSLAFGSQDIDDGPTPPQEVAVTNSGTEGVTISSVGLSGAGADAFAQSTGNGDDCVASKTLAAGQTCKVRLTFDPSTTGSKFATLTIDSNEVPDLTVSLSGFGAQTQLTRAPASLSFGDQDVDEGPTTSTTSTTSTITNSGTDPVSISGVDVTGDFAQLTDDINDCKSSTVLGAGQTCKLRVTFDPTATGARTGSATVHSNSADVSVALDGTGIQTGLGVAPGTLAFGNRDIDDGPSATQESTVANTGTQPVTLSSLTLTGASFARTTGAASDCTATTTLTAGQICKVRITFDPSATGAKTGAVAIGSSAGPLTIALTGTGTQTLLAAAPPALSLGSQDVDEGPTSAQTSTLTNVGSEPVTLTGVNLSGADFDRVTGAGSDCANGTVLNAGQTCELRVRFDPSSVGAKTGNVTVTSNAADVAIALDATGIQTELTRNPNALDFGSRNVSAGATTAQELTLTNSGTQALTLSAVGISGTNANQFQRLSGDAADCGPGTALVGGATCTVRVRFRPTSPGAKAAGVTVASSAGGDLVTPLAGTGLPRPKLSIPAFHAAASSTAHKRLKVAVVPVGGTIRNIVVEVRSRGGKLLGTGRLTTASGKRTVTVKLKKPLAAGRYVAKARGSDAFKHRTATASRTFSLTARRVKTNGGGGSGGGRPTGGGPGDGGGGGGGGGG